MIFYFSGTGNSKWVAEQIADKLGDTAINITTLKTIPSIGSAETIGVIFPVYAWSPPEPVLEFVKALPHTEAFTFAVCTCGDEAGNSAKIINRHFPTNSAYSVVMPSNYIVGADVENEDIILKKIELAKTRIEKIVQDIKGKKDITDVRIGSLAILKSSLASFGFNKFARTTKPFHITDSCIGCGLCEQNCPANTIKLVDKKPVWGEKCYQCLSCINRCPVCAIQYGKATETRKRYLLEKFI